MNIVLLGAPGAGKGTQAELICQALNIPRISSGDILRTNIKNKTDLGKKAQKIMSEGHLLEDDIILTLILERIKEKDCDLGFLLDGFPRTLGQAKLLEQEKIPLDAIINIDVPDEIIINRLKGRLIHVPSGRSYHIEFNPPLEPGIDDITQEKLVMRNDDEFTIVKSRLALYHQETVPVYRYYKQEKYFKNLITVSGHQDKMKIFSIIINFIRKISDLKIK